LVNHFLKNHFKQVMFHCPAKQLECNTKELIESISKPYLQDVAGCQQSGAVARLLQALQSS